VNPILSTTFYSVNGRRYRLINRKDLGKPLGKISLELTAGECAVEEFKGFNMKSICQ